MKYFILALSFGLPTLASASSSTEWKSVYTNLKTDCVAISAANDKAEIDFADSECKAFGGYELHIDGGDLRYGPSLLFKGQPLEIGRPGAFHDPGSDKVEWIYAKTSEADGAGTIAWKGFVYSLSVANQDGEGSKRELTAVRLDGENTCSLGLAKTNEAARQLVRDSKPGCR
jgi:hypothetical protein